MMLTQSHTLRDVNTISSLDFSSKSIPCLIKQGIDDLLHYLVSKHKKYFSVARSYWVKIRMWKIHLEMTHLLDRYLRYKYLRSQFRGTELKPFVACL